MSRPYHIISGRMCTGAVGLRAAVTKVVLYDVRRGAA
jgi:hypothetical protein